MHTICCFESWEVRSPYLQTVLDLDLKRKIYGRFKMTVQTMSGNVAPPFCYCWTHFWSTLWSSNYAYHISFQILGSQESNASNGMWFGGEMKKLWPFEDKRAKLNGNFAAKTPFGKVFRSCETTFGTRVPFCSIVPLILKLRYSCEITFELRNHFLAHECHFVAPYTHCRAAKSLLSIEMAAKWLRNHLQALKWLQNHLQASKWPSNCKIDLRNGGRFAKTPCKAKGSC